MQWQTALVQTVFSLLVLQRPALAKDKEEPSPLVVKPVTMKVQMYSNVTVECTTTLPGAIPAWTDINRTTIAQLNNPRLEDINGTLNIFVIDETLDGVYCCSVQPANHTQCATVEAYIMPTYFKEGMIILGIGAGLIFIFCVIFMKKHLKSHGSREKYAPRA